MGNLDSLLVLLAVAYGIFFVLLPVVVGFLFKRVRELEQRLRAIESLGPEPSRSAAAPDRSRADASTSEAPQPPEFEAATPIPGPAPSPKPAAVPPRIETPQQPIEPVAGPATVTRGEVAARRPETTATAWPAIDALASDAWAKRIKDWLTGGHTLARIGVIILFFGVAFLLKYAAEQGLLPIELRLTGAALGGLALLVIGWRLRERKRVYGLILQGGGIGIVYLTVFATVSMYRLLPALPGQALMVTLVTLAAALAVLQNARGLAVLAMVGGFLAPVLISAGGSHVVLFTYYAILNAGILAIAWFKAWRELNLIGFVFTFIIGSAWGQHYYRPEFFATTEPFLLAFFLFYVAVPILFALRAPTKLKGYVDGPLVFGAPLVAAALQAALVRDFEYGLAISAFGAGFFYVLLASSLWRIRQASLQPLVESFLALGVAFATLAIPFAVDGRWTGAAWGLEGAALIWIGVRQRRILPRLSGLAVQVVAGLAFLSDYGATSADLPVFNSSFLSALMLSLGGLLSAYHLYAGRERLLPAERESSVGALIWGLLWWATAGLGEIWRHVAWSDRSAAAVIFVAASAMACGWLDRRLSWHPMRYPPLLLLPFMALTSVTMFASQDTHPFAAWGLIAWPLAVAAHYRLLWRYETLWPDEARLMAHVGVLWLILFLLSWELAWQAGRLIPGNATWPLVAWALIPVITIERISDRGRALSWPFGRWLGDYLDYGLGPVALFLLGWTLYASAQTGDPRPLPYIPVINPVELLQIASLVALAIWSYRGLPDLDTRIRISALAALGFLVLNTIIGRSTHFMVGVPYTLRSLFESAYFQSATSIIWTVMSLALTVLATRRGYRPVWFAGIGLLILVVAKLFLIDLAGVGTIARIVSFIVVGILILVVAYLSPLPPTQGREQHS